MDLPIAVDVSCAPIVVPDDTSVPDAPAPELSEATEVEAAPEAAPAVGVPKVISGCPVVSIVPGLKICQKGVRILAMMVCSHVQLAD